MIGLNNGTLSFNLPIPRDFMFIRVFVEYTADELKAALNDVKYVLSSFTFLPDVSLYLSIKGCKTFVYVNEAKRQTLVFMPSLNQRSWHKMQSALPKLLSWYFTTTLTDDETKVLQSLTQKDSNTYIDLISTFAKKLNLREERLKKLLKDFGMNFEKQRYKSLIDERNLNAEHFQRLQEEISMRIARERELLSDISGLEIILQQGDRTGLSDYFICNKSLHLVEVNENNITYVVTTYLEYFDQKVFEKCFNNPSSCFYKNETESMQDQQNFKRLLSATYGDEISIRVRTCAAFTLSISGTLLPLRGSVHLNEYSNWLPNPHIDGVSCMGTNTTHINQLMRDKKYIEAIEQSIASVKNINFADTAIAPRLITNLQASYQKFLELPNGDVVSPSEAIAWLCRERC